MALLLLLLALPAVLQASSPAQKVLRVPLVRAPGAASLVQQQQRVRRRLGDDDSALATVNATANASAVVYSEAPLRVGLGCVQSIKSEIVFCMQDRARADVVDVAARTHYAELYLGVPAQRASVIVDTGSHLTALPCSS